MIRNLLLLLALSSLPSCSAPEFTDPPPTATTGQVLQPWSADINWWSWDGETPELLIGGSSFEAPFLEKDWKAELNYLKKAGGNYVRITLPAFAGDQAPLIPNTTAADGLQTAGNTDYWKLLEQYIDYAEQREIAVEIQVWDYANIASRWDTVVWSSVTNFPAEEYLAGEHPFFRTIPGSVGYRDGYEKEIPTQALFVDLLLSATLPFDNVIYNVQVPDNLLIPWMVHWAKYIETSARETGRTANVNAGIVPDQRISVARFNQGLIAGAAVAFHRPPPNGNGLNGAAQASIRGVRVVERYLKFHELKPAPELLLENDTGAVAATDGKGNYLIYLPSAGSVNLSPEWEQQLPVKVTVVGYLGTQRSETLAPPYGDSFRLYTEEEKGGWMILKPEN